jgi:outer membrane lipoprotein carrier protein
MVAVATAATSSDEESANGRLALERFASDLSTFHATFEQVVLNSDGEIQDANEGEMWLSRPSLFRWEYGGDFPEVIVADGEKIWIYDVSLEQITVKNQSSLASDSPLTLLTDLTRLDQQFEVRDLGADEGLVYVELRSISDDAEFDRVLLGIEGQSSNRNPELASDHFAFEPPENVDIVGDIAVDVDLNSEEAE